jgi:hypothetical protein
VEINLSFNLFTGWFLYGRMSEWVMSMSTGSVGFYIYIKNSYILRWYWQKTNEEWKGGEEVRHN